MKVMIMILMMPLILNAKTTQTLAGAALKADLDATLANERIEDGEMQGMDGGCTFVYDGHKIAIQTANGLEVAVYASLFKSVAVTDDEDGDGSFTKVYQFDRILSLEVVHADDAYDEVMLDEGSAKLTCGVYY